MSNPEGTFISRLGQGLKEEFSGHILLAASADRTVELGKWGVEHLHIAEHYIWLNIATHAISRIPSPLIWAISFAVPIAMEVLYREALHSFYDRVGEKAHQTMHRIPGGAKAEHMVRRHHTKILAQAKKPGVRGYMGAYVELLGEKIAEIGEHISGPHHGGMSLRPT